MTYEDAIEKIQTVRWQCTKLCMVKGLCGYGQRVCGLMK